MSLGVYRDGVEVGRLELSGEGSREYSFTYLDSGRAISLSLPTGHASFTPVESRPFFEGLLPEGGVREALAMKFKLVASDSYGLLAELGRDCAGALQIVAGEATTETPSVRWLDDGELGRLIEELPNRPFGIDPSNRRLRLSLAGAQHKALLVRDAAGRFGEPLDGMPSTHILKPDLREEDHPGLAINERFCMELAARCGLNVARTGLILAAGRRCLVVERFDRDTTASPARRIHQEDLCQALGLMPDFKYQQPEWRLPSYAALADLLDAHSLRPGLDRLAVARGALFSFLIANADAHAKNISLLHVEGGVVLAPLYDLVCTAAYPALDTALSLAIGDELDPARIGLEHWSDFAYDMRLDPAGFERVRQELAATAQARAQTLREEARGEGWYDEVIEAILQSIAVRAPQVV
jgi:serine/threonine-protein kinase HipA